MQRPTFKEVLLLTTNTKAIQSCTRFVDEDLNLQFACSRLRDPSLSETYEAQRAKTLNMPLGPKPGSADDYAINRTDFAIDLHTTTSNMGCCIIVPCDDPFSLRCAVYARSMMEAEGLCTPVKIFRIGLQRHESPYIASCAKHSLIVECGSTPWGVVRYDIVILMQQCIKHILDYVDAAPADLSSESSIAPTSRVPATSTVNVAIISSDTGLPARIPAPADENGRALVSRVRHLTIDLTLCFWFFVGNVSSRPPGPRLARVAHRRPNVCTYGWLH